MLLWGSLCIRKISCPFKKNKNPNQERAPSPYTANFDFKPEQCTACHKVKHSDRADHRGSCACDTKGAHVDYPIALGLFSCREKSVLKLRHWIKVSRTEFEACGWMQPYWGCTTAVLVIPLIKVSAVTAPVTLLLLPSKTQISTQCVTLCYVSFCCPISLSVPSLQALQLLAGWSTVGTLFPAGNEVMVPARTC